jgi:hypothetical protein
MVERVTLVPRRGMTPTQAYEAAREQLQREGFSASRPAAYRVERERIGRIDVYLVHIEFDEAS